MPFHAPKIISKRLETGDLQTSALSFKVNNAEPTHIGWGAASLTADAFSFTRQIKGQTIEL